MDGRKVRLISIYHILKNAVFCGGYIYNYGLQHDFQFFLHNLYRIEINNKCQHNLQEVGDYISCGQLNIYTKYLDI